MAMSRFRDHHDRLGATRGRDTHAPGWARERWPGRNVYNYSAIGALAGTRYGRTRKKHKTAPYGCSLPGSKDMRYARVVSSKEASNHMETSFEELTPLAELVIEGTVAAPERHSATMDRIQALVQERARLYQDMASHPFTTIEYAARVRDINRELDRLWEQERRERAAARWRLERSLRPHAGDLDATEERKRRVA